MFSVEPTGLGTSHVVDKPQLGVLVGNAGQPDTTAPVLSVSPVTGANNREAGHAFSGSLGAADAGLLVTIRDGGTILGTTTSDAQGHFSFALSDHKAGPSHSYSLTASAKDAAGNTGASDSFAFNFDYSSNRESFGTVAHDAGSHLGQVYALYEGLLGRAPEEGGARGWTDALDHGVSLRAVTQSFLDSSESRSHINAASNADFVEQLYHTVLGPPSDAGGKQGWTSLLDHGASRADVADSFVFSSEHLGHLTGAYDAGVYLADSTDAAVARLYHGLLERAPDSGGLQVWAAVAHSGTPLTAIAQGFLGSSEYLSKHAGQTDQQFVDELYLDALGRPADAAGEQAWLNHLHAGASRADVAVGIAESAEAQMHLAAYIEHGWHLS